MRISLILLIVFLITGCTQKKVGTKAYLKYIADDGNGLIKSKEIDGMIVEVKYLTPEAMALNEIQDLSVNKQRFDKVLSEYKGFDYFNIAIRAKKERHIYELLNSEGISEQPIEEYLNYKAQPDLYLVTGSDTAKCTLYSYSQTYALAKQFDIATGFVNIDSSGTNNKVLEFNATMFNRGLMKFVFDRNDINNVPALAL